MAGLCENLQLLCAVCKVGSYSILTRLCCRRQPVVRPEFSAVCIGLTQAGKTTLLGELCKENTKDIEPTTGFIIKDVQFPNCILNIKEIGGGEKVRPFWKHYYKGTQAVIFVVDSAAPEDEFEDAKDALSDALENTALKKLPCLILANCQDKQGARNEAKIKEELQLPQICKGRPWALHLCSKNDINDLRNGFAKLTVFLIAPDDESKNGTSPTPTENRI